MASMAMLNNQRVSFPKLVANVGCSKDVFWMASVENVLDPEHALGTVWYSWIQKPETSNSVFSCSPPSSSVWKIGLFAQKTLRWCLE